MKSPDDTEIVQKPSEWFIHRLGQVVYEKFFFGSRLVLFDNQFTAVVEKGVIFRMEHLAGL